MDRAKLGKLWNLRISFSRPEKPRKIMLLKSTKNWFFFSQINSKNVPKMKDDFQVIYQTRNSVFHHISKHREES